MVHDSITANRTANGHCARIGCSKATLSAMDPALLQLLGSLGAILALAAIAWALRLGQPPLLEDAAHARALAREADTGFDPAEAALSRDRAAAILTDGEGRIMVLRRHGTHFAARILEPGARARCDGEALVVATTDRRFGEVRLDLAEDSRSWASRIGALG